MVRRGLVATVVVLLVSACGGNNGAGVGARAPVADARWSNLNQVPVEPRGDRPVIEWTGSELVLFGGPLLGDGPGTTYAPEGAIFDPARDRWSVLAGPGPLGDPSGAWTGTELVVMGTRCEGPLGHDEGVEGCEPGTLSLVALDPGTESWRDVAVSAELLRAREEAHLSIDGSIGDEVVVFGGSADGLAGPWLVDPRSGTTRTVPEPPFEADGSCSDEDRLVALDYRDEDPHNASGNQFPPTAVLSAAVLRVTPDQLVWSGIEQLPVVDRPAEVANHTCGGGGAFVLRRSSDGRESMDHFDGRRWTTVPSAPAPLGGAPFTSWTGDRLLVWGSGGVWAFRPSTASWSSAGGAPRPSEVIPAGDTVILYTFNQYAESGMSLETIER